MKRLVYKGFLRLDEYKENDEALYVGKCIIAKELEQIKNKFVCVWYWLANTEKTKEELKYNFINSIVGSLDADYNDVYSAYTGYLWTDEKLDVGGHDLLNELRNNIGRYLLLEIDIIEDGE